MSRAQRIAVWVAATAQVVWLACMLALWAWVFDASGDSTLLSVTAILLAAGTMAALGPRLAKIGCGLMAIAELPSASALAAILGRSHSHRHVAGSALVRLFSGVVILAIVGSLTSMVLAFASRYAVSFMRDHMLFTPLAWGVFKLLIQWLAMLPMAGGIVGMFAVGSWLYQEGRTSLISGVCRQWLLATASGMAFFTLTWIDILPLALGMALVMLVVAMVGFWRGPETDDVPIQAPQPDRTGLADRFKLLLGFGALTLVLVVQMRLMGDLLGVTMIGRILWAAGSLALMALVIRRAEGQGGPADINEAVGVTLGVIAAVAMQVALAAAQLISPTLYIPACIWGGLIQIPAVVLMGRLIAHRRQQWVTQGGGLLQFLSRGATGAAMGLLVYLVGGLLPWTGLVAAVALVAGLAAIALGANRARQRQRRMMWRVTGVLLLAAMFLAVVAPMDELKERYGQASRGVWLSLLASRGPNQQHPWQPESSMPYPRTWRSEIVTDVMEAFLHDRYGRWWVIATSQRDMPATGDSWGYYTATSVPDPTANPAAEKRGFLMLGSEGNYLAAAQIGHGLFDGLLLAPLPADHPEAWRCYNQQTLSRCVRRVHRTGVTLLRTQVSQENISDLIAVTETFNEVVGPSWGVIEFRGGMVDLLLMGPRASSTQDDETDSRDRPVAGVTRPTLPAFPGPQVPLVYVFPTEHIQDEQMHIAPIRLLERQGPWRGRELSYNRLQPHLEQVSQRAE